MTAPHRPPLLLCFHHAGAGCGAYVRWQRSLHGAAEVVPVLLPGRAERIREPRVTTRRALLTEARRWAAAIRDRPYALYGHSLGGLVAHTFAGLQEAAGAPPLAVLIGAALPPHLSSPLAHSGALPDRQLLRLLVGQGVLPPAAAGEQGELFRRRVLPQLRDDLALARDLLRVPGPPLRTYVAAVAGRDDPVAPAAGVAEWERYAAGGFRLRTLDGGHLFVRGPALPALLREELLRCSGAVLGTCGAAAPDTH